MFPQHLAPEIKNISQEKSDQNILQNISQTCWKKKSEKKGIQDLTNPRGVLKKQLEAAGETSNYQASYLCLGYLHGERVGVSHVSTLEIISLKWKFHSTHTCH